MKTAATNKKVRELISLVRDGKIIPQPEFQRRLVWTHKDKNRFLDTVLNGLPFPEIYLADGDVDLATGQGAQLLVDGLQRVSTLIQYFNADPNLRLLSVPAYQTLGDDEKRAYLQYDVAVRDLGALTREMIVEVFQRINATKYALTDIEINNALYSGELKKYASEIAALPFFEAHPIFSPSDYKRMGDLRFALSVVCTFLRGYFNRDDAFEELLARFNDEFPNRAAMEERVMHTLSFIDECAFEAESRAWKKADLFTLLVETDACTRDNSLPQPSDAVNRLGLFYSRIDSLNFASASVEAIYHKAALQASNDRGNRIRRGVIVNSILKGLSAEAIESTMKISEFI